MSKQSIVMKKYIILLLISITLVMTACETPCQRRYRIDGADWYSAFVYKFPEGRDLSNNVMVYKIPMVDSVRYIPGYRPIPLRDGYYLDGPIAKTGGEPEFYYLTITYDEIESGTAPDDWIEHWKDYLIPCWRYPSYMYCAYSEFYFIGYCDCPDEECGFRHQVPYNEAIILETPIVEDIHIDTSIINQWILENDLCSPHMLGGPIVYDWR